MPRPYGKKPRSGKKRRYGKPADPSVEIRRFVVDLMDKGDGNGVDWRVACEAVFKAGFYMLDRLATQQKRGMARRICITAYARFNGDGQGDIGGVERPPECSPDGQVFQPRPEQRAG